MKRVIFDIFLFVSIFTFPWWISVFLLVVGIFLFSNFYEFIIASIAIFGLYSTPNGRLIASPAFYSSFIIILYIFIQYIRDNIILYKK
jgi:hypothetical protein